MPFPVVLFAVAAAAMDLFILAGGMVASMNSEPPKCSCQISEKRPEDIGALPEHPGDANSEQNIDEMRASSPVAMNVEPFLPSDSTFPMTTPILGEQPRDLSVATDVEPVIPGDNTSSTPFLLGEQSSIASASKATKPVPQLSVDESDQRLSRISRKRRASSITSSVQSVTSHEPSSLTDPLVASSIVVASGSQFSGHALVNPSVPVYDYHEVRPNKKPHEDPPRPWVVKVVHSTRHRLSDLRPSKYSHRFRKQIRSELCRKDSYNSTYDG